MNRRNSTVFIAIAAALLCFPAAAQPNPNQRAEAEARAMLPKCNQPDRDLQQLCLRNQRDFIREYVKAKAGSDINIRGIASYLRPVPPTASDFEKSLHVGIPTRLQEACAWRLWHAMMPDIDEELTAAPEELARRIRDKRLFWQPTCLQLDFDKRNASLARATHLMNEYLSTPARMPPSEWQPKVAGLVEPKPGPPSPDHCMLTVAPPLNAQPGWRQPRLPADCP